MLFHFFSLVFVVKIAVYFLFRLPSVSLSPLRLLFFSHHSTLRFFFFLSFFLPLSFSHISHASRLTLHAPSRNSLAAAKHKPSRPKPKSPKAKRFRSQSFLNHITHICTLAGLFPISEKTKKKTKKKHDVCVLREKKDSKWGGRVGMILGSPPFFHA